MKNFVISFFFVFIGLLICVSAVEKELGIWNKVDELPDNDQRRIKRCYCGGYGSYGYSSGGYYPSYGGGYGGYPSYGGFGGGMPYGFGGSPFGGFYA